MRMDKDRGLLRSLEAYIHNNNKASILLDAPKFKEFLPLGYCAIDSVGGVERLLISHAVLSSYVHDVN